MQSLSSSGSLKSLAVLTDQLTKQTSNSGQKDLVFVKSCYEDSNVSKLNVERPWLSEAEGFNLPNNDIGRILPPESQVNATNSLVTDYDSSEESTLVCSILLPPLEKLSSPEPQIGPNTIKLILRSFLTRKVETSKGVIINCHTPPRRKREA
ncbi:hypothetical protein Tco_0725026 [Tanacetum coccineum]|uniref:Uncharacterized protein n=1 Tax=Tanacetum coccineum TaxID=301880 RepID=A0ABQ4YDX1_9ASTR